MNIDSTIPPPGTPADFRRFPLCGAIPRFHGVLGHFRTPCISTNYPQFPAVAHNGVRQIRANIAPTGETMPTFRKRGKSWRAEVRRKGVTQSATFQTKARAVEWAAKVESEIADGKAGAVPDKSFGDLLKRYRDEVSVRKKGERWERVRIHAILEDTIAKVRLRELDETHIAEWRDRRCREVSDGSVRRDWTLLSHACNVAIKEWKWLKSHPMSAVRRPAQPPHREAYYSADQITRLGYALGDDPATATGRVVLAFRFALETAMRAGEICGLTWDRVDLSRRVVTIQTGKTASARRQVPLSTEAVRLLQSLPVTDGPVFGLDTATLDALFRKGKKRALIEGLTFHDSRATAIMRLAGKLDILDLARMVGHRDLRMLMVYYRKTAQEIAPNLG